MNTQPKTENFKYDVVRNILRNELEKHYSFITIFNDKRTEGKRRLKVWRKELSNEMITKINKSFLKAGFGDIYIENGHSYNKRYRNLDTYSFVRLPAVYSEKV